MGISLFYSQKKTKNCNRRKQKRNREIGRKGEKILFFFTIIEKAEEKLKENEVVEWLILFTLREREKDRERVGW